MVATLRRMNSELVSILVVDTFDDVYATMCQPRIATVEVVKPTDLATIRPVGRRAPERRPDGTTVREVLSIDHPERAKIIERLRRKANLVWQRMRRQNTA